MFFRPLYIMAVRSLTYTKNSFVRSYPEKKTRGKIVHEAKLWWRILILNWGAPRCRQQEEHWRKCRCCVWGAVVPGRNCEGPVWCWPALTAMLRLGPWGCPHHPQWGHPHGACPSRAGQQNSNVWCAVMLTMNCPICNRYVPISLLFTIRKLKKKFKLRLVSDLSHRKCNYRFIWWFRVVSDLSPTLGKIGHQWF